MRTHAHSEPYAVKHFNQIVEKLKEKFDINVEIRTEVRRKRFYTFYSVTKPNAEKYNGAYTLIGEYETVAELEALEQGLIEGRFRIHDLVESLATDATYADKERKTVTVNARAFEKLTKYVLGPCRRCDGRGRIVKVGEGVILCPDCKGEGTYPTAKLAKR